MKSAKAPKRGCDAILSDAWRKVE